MDDKTGAKNVIAPGGGMGWVVRASREAHNCKNPITIFEEDVFSEPLKQRDPDKELIMLCVGESPTHHECQLNTLSVI